ncbi:hypothetical protein PENSPDRAFT_643268 [Peniophora sp. CONT]|nr:hypothetical protein PENSPDRAFT_643268 [Peniophora sp. CONT]
MAAMPDIRIVLSFLVLIIVSYGTRYSILNSTFLDTSDPFITTTHHLTGSHFFASKKNPLNVYFLKYTWAWTSAAFLPALATTPPERWTRRALQYATAMMCWVAFTSWFFGPALIERIVDYTGGQCVVHVDDRFFVPVPVEYCFRRELISHHTHPDLFPAPLLELEAEPSVPRLRRGHDVSGHIFLLTLSVLFLGDQIRQSLAFKRYWNIMHRGAIIASGAVSLLWLFSLWVTSVYFHTAYEKYTGLAIGFFSFALSQVPVYFLPAEFPPAAVQAARAERRERRMS